MSLWGIKAMPPSMKADSYFQLKTTSCGHGFQLRIRTADLRLTDK